MFLIDWMPQSAVTLYIYRVGWTYPARNLVYISKSIKIPSCTRTLLGPVRPVGRIRPATGKPQPVRPPTDTSQTGLPILVINICPPVLWQSLRAKEHSSVPKLSKGDDQ